MSAVKLPRVSKFVIVGCGVAQLVCVAALLHHEHASALAFLSAIIISAFITDLISGVAHFTFDYVWSDDTPILGPISVEFRQHHDRPILHSSDIWNNFTKGAYASLPILLLTITLMVLIESSPINFFILMTLLMASIWMMAFHQVHTYSHMGNLRTASDFSRSLADIKKLPKVEQKLEIRKLFDFDNIPRWIRLLQRFRIILRPEIHWLHHQSYESDFSSLNGWSDPLMNLIYRPLSRRRKTALHAK